MKFRIYKDVKEFYKDTYDILLRHEGQNLIPLGNIIIGNKGGDKTGWRDPVNWFMATVSDGSGVILSAVMTPPFNITLYATDNNISVEALGFLVDEIEKAAVFVPGVMSEKALALKFAEKYTEAKGMKHRIEMNQRIYELTEVNPEIPRIGHLRPAKESDMAFLPYWIDGFYEDALEAPEKKLDAEVARYHMASNRLYILEDKETPVSMVKITREMVNACGIGIVYTPPYFRGKGYATSCVAGVSRMVLERGYLKCVLYTDLENPTSNSIYQKIGYRPVCDSLSVKFVQL